MADLDDARRNAAHYARAHFGGAHVQPRIVEVYRVPGGFVPPPREVAHLTPEQALALLSDTVTMVRVRLRFGREAVVVLRDYLG
ncbi:hypothetical protein [Gryllotalpicola sp.]|uniref:hypothetical protein n=1 Tax=Gryllotalpicola sp. TaxID=1932787 RepID=UPI002613BDF8|nr:hypothetical protein [Gryllotalpicola sp.]